MQLPTTTNRVASHTAPHINRAIRNRTEQSIRFHESHPEQIGRRLREIDREWDIERALEANASTLVVLGSTLGLTVSRKFMVLPLMVGSFLLQHALQGWCPPLPILRRLGFRTAAEIQEERDALQKLRSVH